MKSVLVISWSQTGQSHDVAESFVRGLDRRLFDVTVERLRPRVPFPFPWTIGKFFGVMPECVLGRPAEVEQPAFAPGARFDLVVLAWQVWFLAPSLPVQGFLASGHAGVLRGTPVVGLCVCRNMWHTASESMKKLIARAGGVLIDSIVVTDQGPPWAGFVTTPRWMFTGRRDRFLGLPPAGVSDEEIRGLERFGRAIGERAAGLDAVPPRSLLRGLGAVKVETRYVIPELVGRYSFAPWARLIRALGPRDSLPANLATVCFVIYLVFAILVLVPLGILSTVLFYPFLRGRLHAYIHRLSAPSGLDPADASA